MTRNTEYVNFALCEPRTGVPLKGGGPLDPLKGGSLKGGLIGPMKEGWRMKSLFEGTPSWQQTFLRGPSDGKHPKGDPLSRGRKKIGPLIWGLYTYMYYLKIEHWSYIYLLRFDFVRDPGINYICENLRTLLAKTWPFHDHLPLIRSLAVLCSLIALQSQTSDVSELTFLKNFALR